MNENGQEQRDPRASEVIKKLRAESKSYRRQANEARSDLETAGHHVGGALLLSQFNREKERVGEQLERGFLACDMAMIAATAQKIAAELPIWPNDETQLDAMKMQTSALFRDAAKLQKALIPFSIKHSEFEETGNPFEPEDLKKYLHEMEGLWPLLAQTEIMYDAAIQWRNLWTQNMNLLLKAQNV